TGLQNQFVRLAVDARGTRKEASLTFEIPKDRTVLYAYASGTGKPSVYTNSSGKKRYYDARWNWNGDLQGIHTKESNGLLTLYEMPNPARFFWRTLTGSHALTGRADTYYGADISIDSAVLYVSEAGAAVPPALREGRFLEKEGQLYAEDLVFSGRGLVSFAAQDGTVVRNLRVYSVSGGSEVTALTCAFRGESDLDGWSGETASAVIAPFAIQKEEPARVYAKGETIRYQVFYGDYEHDPGKKQHWVYTHEALTDGPFPQAGQDLSSPVTKFYVDGKYTATHWQEDDTGNSAYDKESNKVEITFYINSGPGSGAPWVKSIKTDPAAVRAGDAYTVRAAVDDSDKDPLTVTVEVYKDQGSQPVGKKTVRDLKPEASGRYPDVVLSGLPAAAAGTYDIVVSVKDDDGADVDTLRFRVKEARSLTGTVTHTAAWEANRLAWNEAMKGADAVRPENMFWPGEMLVLNAPCTGDPVSVDAQIREFPQYAARLTRGAAGADGKPVYTGQLWHSSMLTVIGTARPVPATVRFTAQYADGSKLTWDVAIVFDQSRGSYYQLHRTY
ncbi:MAG: hypothetical protein II474_06710, partial [Firmicutes bacterium]|nr:hypothetical protein [Bacillota bacterium]